MPIISAWAKKYKLSQTYICSLRITYHGQISWDFLFFELWNGFSQYCNRHRNLAENTKYSHEHINIHNQKWSEKIVHNRTVNFRSPHTIPQSFVWLQYQASHQGLRKKWNLSVFFSAWLISRLSTFQIFYIELSVLCCYTILLQVLFVINLQYGLCWTLHYNDFTTCTLYEKIHKLNFRKVA